MKKMKNKTIPQIGDTLYFIYDKKLMEGIVKSIDIDTDNDDNKLAGTYGLKGLDQRVYCVSIYDTNSSLTGIFDTFLSRFAQGLRAKENVLSTVLKEVRRKMEENGLKLKG